MVGSRISLSSSGLFQIPDDVLKCPLRISNTQHWEHTHTQLLMSPQLLLCSLRTPGEGSSIIPGILAGHCGLILHSSPYSQTDLSAHPGGFCSQNTWVPSLSPSFNSTCISNLEAPWHLLHPSCRFQPSMHCHPDSPPCHSQSPLQGLHSPASDPV